MAKKQIPTARGRCPKRTWNGFLEITGGKKELAKDKILSIEIYTETWILPVSVSFASAAYALLAVVFYNTE